ncbi:hypothetical protein KVV02_004607 [Mortierella alpina]|uniref:Uncharacterized protein n=1 Tax=Mortierella alpina TaxID=64518 RepID=A0A9P8A5A0_MORAP|nr:hypothetical protein KVV02_004607 [Mortierella alpina]
MDDHDEGYYYTGQTPFRKPNESKLHFHARRLISIQTLGRLEYTVEEAETKFNRALGPVELTFVGLGLDHHDHSVHLEILHDLDPPLQKPKSYLVWGMPLGI